MAHRFFLTGSLPQDGRHPLPLSPEDVHHAVRVLRTRSGEVVELVEPGGRVMSARVVSADEDGLVVTDIAALDGSCGQQPHVALFQGVAKGDKMESIVRQAVEVGVAEIVAVMMARTVVRLDPGKRTGRQERWQRIAKSAAEQSKRSVVPSVSEPVSFSAALAMLDGYDRVVTLWEEHRGRGIAHALSGLEGTGARVAFVVGPEGGLCADEVQALEDRGSFVASLGPTIMRTETAAVVSLALGLAALGGMGGHE